MEKLTKQQLSVYLPYSLSLKDKSGDIWHMQIDPILPFETTIKGVLENNMKPILYPISCLTKEITHKGETFVPIVELLKTLMPDSYAYVTRDISKGGEINGAENIKGIQLKKLSETFVLSQGKKTISFSQWQIFQKLAEWHINFLNIPDGLFIDKSKL